MSANSITADLLVALNERYQAEGILVFRLNVIVARASRGAVRSAPNGVADVIGCVCGCPVAIEVKAGRDRIKKGSAQERFRDQWQKAGGIHVVAKSPEQALADLEQEIQKRRRVA